MNNKLKISTKAQAETELKVITVNHLDQVIETFEPTPKKFLLMTIDLLGRVGVTAAAITLEYRQLVKTGKVKTGKILTGEIFEVLKSSQKEDSLNPTLLVTPTEDETYKIFVTTAHQGLLQVSTLEFLIEVPSLHALSFIVQDFCVKTYYSIPITSAFVFGRN